MMSKNYRMRNALFVVDFTSAALAQGSSFPRYPGELVISRNIILVQIRALILYGRHSFKTPYPIPFDESVSDVGEVLSSSYSPVIPYFMLYWSFFYAISSSLYCPLFKSNFVLMFSLFLG